MELPDCFSYIHLLKNKVGMFIYQLVYEFHYQGDMLKQTMYSTVGSCFNAPSSEMCPFTIKCRTLTPNNPTWKSNSIQYALIYAVQVYAEGQRAAILEGC